MSDHQIVSMTLNINPGQVGGAAVTCPGGKRAIAGGSRPANFAAQTSIVASYPQNASVWNAQVRNDDAAAQSFTFYAICVNVATMSSAWGMGSFR